jgi:hypothetical protein
MRGPALGVVVVALHFDTPKAISKIRLVRLVGLARVFAGRIICGPGFPFRKKLGM